MKKLYIIIVYTLYFNTYSQNNSSSINLVESENTIVLSKEINKDEKTHLKKEIHKKTCSSKKCDTTCHSKSRDLLIEYKSEKKQELEIAIEKNTEELKKLKNIVSLKKEDLANLQKSEKKEELKTPIEKTIRELKMLECIIYLKNKISADLQKLLDNI
jgi:hypothetical protein